MTATVEVDFVGQDNLSGVLGNIGNVFTGLNSIVELTGKAFNAVEGAIMPFIDAASGSEQAISKLNTVLASTQGTTTLTSKQLQDMATNMMNLSGNSDEAEMSAEAMLLRFENLNDIFPQSLQLTNDLARSMGIDLTTAAQTIGKALDDPEAGIGRLNTAFKLFDQTEMDNIKTMAAHGDLAGAQALIMERLTEKVGGAADAYGKTFAGSLDIAKEKLDNLKELIGGPIITAFTSLIQAVVDPALASLADSPLFVFLQRVNDFTGQGAPLIYSLGLAMVELGKAGGIISPIFFDIGKALLDVQHALDNGVSPLEAFKKGLDDLAVSFVGSPFEGVIKSIQEFINTGQSEGWGAAISELFGTITTALGNWIVSLNLGDKLQVALDNIALFINTWAGNGGADGITTTLGNVIGGAIKSALEGLDKTVGQVDFGPFILALTKAVGAGVISALNGIGNLFWDWFAKDVFGDPSQAVFWDGVQQGFSNFGTLIIKALFPMTLGTDISRAARAAFVSIGSDIQAGVEQGLNSIGLGWWVDWWDTHVVKAVKSFLGISSPSTVFAGIGMDIINGLLGGLKSTWDSVSSWFTEKFSNLLSNLTWANILKVISGDMSIADLFSSGSGMNGTKDDTYIPPGGTTTGTNTGTGSTSTTGGTGTGNAFAFYNCTFNVNTMDEFLYDCINPNATLTSLGTVPGGL